MKGISIATIVAVFALCGSVFGGIQIADTRYVSAQSFDAFTVEIFYEQYYKAEDRLIDAQDDDDDPDRINELDRRLERLRAKICKIEPDWEQCPDPG